jgi:hypothetical protein
VSTKIGRHHAWRYKTHRACQGYVSTAHVKGTIWGFLRYLERDWVLGDAEEGWWKYGRTVVWIY